MIQYGYNVGVINETENVIVEFIQNLQQSRTNTTFTNNKINILWSLTVSFYDVGGIIGILIVGLILSGPGRKQAVLFINIFALIGTILIVLSKPIKSYEIIIIGRLLTGCHGGISTVLVPMYLSEISPKILRGGFGTLTNLCASIGMLFSMILGIREILGNKERWPYLFGLNIIPSILQLMLLPFCPESPRYLLITKNREAAARNALEKLRYKTSVDNEIEEIKAEKRILEQNPNLNMLQVIINNELRRPLLISVIMQFSVQFSGIFILFYYSTRIFISAGILERAACYATAGLGVVILIMSIVSTLLMDRAGRRILHLTGLAGMFFCGILLTTALALSSRAKWMPYLAVLSVFVFVVFFALGPASISFLITAELFTQSSRSAAVSIAILMCWFAKILVGLSFPVLLQWLDDYVILPYSISLIFFWVFTFVALPETKNKTFVETADLFKKK